MKIIKPLCAFIAVAASVTTITHGKAVLSEVNNDEFARDSSMGYSRIRSEESWKMLDSNPSSSSNTNLLNFESYKSDEEVLLMPASSNVKKSSNTAQNPLEGQFRFNYPNWAPADTKWSDSYKPPVYKTGHRPAPPNSCLTIMDSSNLKINDDQKTAEYLVLGFFEIYKQSNMYSIQAKTQCADVSAGVNSVFIDRVKPNKSDLVRKTIPSISDMSKGVCDKPYTSDGAYGCILDGVTPHTYKFFHHVRCRNLGFVPYAPLEAACVCDKGSYYEAVSDKCKLCSSVPGMKASTSDNLWVTSMDHRCMCTASHAKVLNGQCRCDEGYYHDDQGTCKQMIECDANLNMQRTMHGPVSKGRCECKHGFFENSESTCQRRCPIGDSYWAKGGLFGTGDYRCKSYTTCPSDRKLVSHSPINDGICVCINGEDDTGTCISNQHDNKLANLFSSTADFVDDTKPGVYTRTTSIEIGSERHGSPAILYYMSQFEPCEILEAYTVSITSANDKSLIYEGSVSSCNRSPHVKQIESLTGNIEIVESATVLTQHMTNSGSPERLALKESLKMSTAYFTILPENLLTTQKNNNAEFTIDLENLEISDDILDKEPHVVMSCLVESTNCEPRKVDLLAHNNAVIATVNMVFEGACKRNDWNMLTTEHANSPTYGPGLRKLRFQSSDSVKETYLALINK